jgi:hypothetical protein
MSNLKPTHKIMPQHLPTWCCRHFADVDVDVGSWLSSHACCIFESCRGCTCIPTEHGGGLCQHMPKKDLSSYNSKVVRTAQKGNNIYCFVQTICLFTDALEHSVLAQNNARCTDQQQKRSRLMYAVHVVHHVVPVALCTTVVHVAKTMAAKSPPAASQNRSFTLYLQL